MRVALAEGLSAMVWATYFDEIELFGNKADVHVLVNGRIWYGFPLGET